MGLHLAVSTGKWGNLETINLHIEQYLQVCKKFVIIFANLAIWQLNSILENHSMEVNLQISK